MKNSFDVLFYVWYIIITRRLKLRKALNIFNNYDMHLSSNETCCEPRRPSGAPPVLLLLVSYDAGHVTSPWRTQSGDEIREKRQKIHKCQASFFLFL